MRRSCLWPDGGAHSRSTLLPAPRRGSRPDPAAWLAALALTFFSAGGCSQVRADILPVIDSIVVDKSLRRLYLVRNGETARAFEIALGLAPKGRKQQEGDYRTPEGEYHISARKPDSSYMLALQVSYPNQADRARADAAEVPAGGLIMIHGRPIRPSRGRDRSYYSARDWTDGCIAVSNAAMLEIWTMTRLGTPITIKP